MARPSKYTPERVKEIMEALRGGNTRKASSEYGGIDEDTFGNWMKRYSDFSDAVKKAESQAEVRCVAIISMAAKKSWQAAAWWLERRKPKDWAATLKQEVTGNNGGPLKVIVEYADIDPAEAA